ncbi:MAG: 50S ribosomal protein L17 [Chlorobi bacterium CHB2]|nr:50S ribosomal protein L17 [Chlorobi bacterium CHB2]
MRHNVEGRKLKRTASHRRALLRALTVSLLRHKRIRTTEAKAKEARRFAEAIITRAKNAYLAEKAGSATNIHARRVVARDINDAAVLKELFSEIAQKVAERPGGYTRVVKLGQRIGDGARVAILELVDYNTERDDNAVRSRAKRMLSRAERVARSRAKQAELEAKQAQAAAPVAEAAVETEATAEAAPEMEQSAAEAPTVETPATEAPAAETGEAPAEGEPTKE